ncbi:MAG: tetratricopeptide repeat protein [Planctomycetaceae bacterium]|nr:tetratricopeptide repeat protein [Planctomycetaceae bacterium]
MERNKTSLIICVALVAAVVAVYWPVYKFEFVSYDDESYVINNDNIKTGLNFDSIRWAFTTGHVGNWHPLTWLSLAFDYQLFKNHAGGFHVVNVFYHVINTLLLFYLFKYLTNAIWPSAFIAAAFAVHPLHVESVAWVSERKDVLSTMFWFLTMLAYAKFVKDKNIKWYLSAIVLFVLGLMSKPMLVTLPVVLLLLDYWPLERKFNKHLLIEKIPFFVLSFLSCVVTFLVQQNSGAVADIEKISLKLRLYNVIVSYTVYIWKMIWPAELAVLYPYPASGIAITKVIGCAVLLVLITILVIRFGKRYKFLPVGWLWYVGTLVPVIGLVQVGSQAYADRYTYIPLIGIFVIMTFGSVQYLSKRNCVFLSMLLLVCWAFAAGRQVRYWQNSITLYERTLSVTKYNYNILGNYLICLNEIGEFNRVIEMTPEFLEVKPESTEMLNNMGIALAQTGRLSEAMEYFKTALKYNPADSLANFNLGVAMQSQNKLSESVEFYRKALESKPKYIAASVNLAVALLELGDAEKAADAARMGLRYYPNDGNLLGIIDDAMNKMKENK